MRPPDAGTVPWHEGVSPAGIRGALPGATLADRRREVTAAVGHPGRRGR